MVRRSAPFIGARRGSVGLIGPPVYIAVAMAARSAARYRMLPGHAGCAQNRTACFLHENRKPRGGVTHGEPDRLFELLRFVQRAGLAQGAHYGYMVEGPSGVLAAVDTGTRGFVSHCHPYVGAARVRVD